MKARPHGGSELFVSKWLIFGLMTLVRSEPEISAEVPQLTDDASTVSTNSSSLEELVMSQRRSPRFDTAESSPWVRVYNRPPGTKSETFFNYETKGNVTTQTSSEKWDSFRKETAARIDRREGKTKDILRTKTKVKDTSLKDNNLETTKVTSSTTAAPLEINTTTSVSVGNNESQSKAYIKWSSKEHSPLEVRSWTFEDPKIADNKDEPVDDTIPITGNHWKVVGEGGDSGWQVLDDKGEVEWKIEYDDGEWRVTSTGDVPGDAEWTDPEYIWEDDYGSWQDCT